MTDKELLTEARSIVNKWIETDVFKGVTVRRDNRMSAQGKIDFNTKKISINLKKVTNLNSLRITVLHELGHIYYKNDLTDNQEYLAHKFALEALRVFYGDSYGYALDCLKETIQYEGFEQERPEHYEAFKRLYEEYKENILEK